MSAIAERLDSMGLVLPPAVRVPAGIKLPFPWVSVRGERVLISGHGPQNPDGTISGPFGKVGESVDVDLAALLARKTALSMLGSLQRELGDLDRIVAWHRVFGMVNCGPGFGEQPTVVNGFSELILEVFGADVGRHTRSAVGMAALPLGMAVEIEAELQIAR